MSSNGRSDMRAIMNQIQVWLEQTNFVSEQAGATDMDLVIEQLGQNPDKYIDPALADDFMEAASANYEIIKEEFGLMGQGELDDLLADAPKQARDSAQDEIRAQLDEFGVDAVAQALDHLPGVDPELQQRVDDVLQEFPPDIYFAEMKNRIAEAFEVAGFPVQITRREEVQERREQREQSARRRMERQVLEQIRRELGVTGEDLDLVLQEIEDRMEAGEAVAIETGGIFLEVRPGQTTIEVPDQFQEWRGAVVRAADRELQLENAQSLIDPDAEDRFARQARVRIGTITTEDGQLADIDLTEGRQELGEAETATGEAGPEEAEPDEPTELADSLIDALEEGT